MRGVPTWENMAIAANNELRCARTSWQLAHVDGPTRFLPVTQVLGAKRAVELRT